MYIAYLNEQYDIDGETSSQYGPLYQSFLCSQLIVEYTTETIWIVALKHIQAGAELSCNYGYDARVRQVSVSLWGRYLLWLYRRA
jgi:hypothetical protein